MLKLHLAGCYLRDKQSTVQCALVVDSQSIDRVETGLDSQRKDSQVGVHLIQNGRY